MNKKLYYFLIGIVLIGIIVVMAITLGGCTKIKNHKYSRTLIFTHENPMFVVKNDTCYPSYIITNGPGEINNLQYTRNLVMNVMTGDSIFIYANIISKLHLWDSLDMKDKIYILDTIPGSSYKFRDTIAIDSLDTYHWIVK